MFVQSVQFEINMSGAVDTHSERILVFRLFLFLTTPSLVVSRGHDKKTGGAWARGRLRRRRGRPWFAIAHASTACSVSESCSLVFARYCSVFGAKTGERSSAVDNSSQSVTDAKLRACARKNCAELALVVLC